MHRSQGDIVFLKLFVLAAKDAHILLSPTKNPDKNSPVYEIVLGAGGNTFSEIRRRKQTLPLYTLRIKDLLSAIDPLPITIRITLDGLIEVSIIGQNKPLMSATDPNPLPISYMSFSSWGAAEGKWFYDCKIDNVIDGDELDIVIPEQTPEERLRANLFNSYDPSITPDGLKNVVLAFELHRVTYDSVGSSMRTNGIFRLVSILQWILSIRQRYPFEFDSLGTTPKWYGIQTTMTASVVFDHSALVHCHRFGYRKCDY